MAWLVSHMWIALAGAGVLGLLFGSALRGLLTKGRHRRAIAERDVAQHELAEVRADLDKLVAAQRSDTGQPVSPAVDPTAMKAEIEQRDRRVNQLTEELSRTKKELMGLRGGGSAIAAAGANVAAVGAALPRPAKLDANLDQEEASLVWRNRHLESRVRFLESKVTELAAVPDVAPASVPTPVVAPVATVVEPPAPATVAPVVDTAELDKLRWQADYLKTRVEVLENQIASAPVAAAVASESGGVDTPAVVSSADVDAGLDTPNEELAKLRWRNRYLESKIAYYEGGSEDAAVDASQALADVTPSSDVQPASEESSATVAAPAAVDKAVAAAEASPVALEATPAAEVPMASDETAAVIAVPVAPQTGIAAASAVGALGAIVAGVAEAEPAPVAQEEPLVELPAALTELKIETAPALLEIEPEVSKNLVEAVVDLPFDVSMEAVREAVAELPTEAEAPEHAPPAVDLAELAELDAGEPVADVDITHDEDAFDDREAVEAEEEEEEVDTVELVGVRPSQMDRPRGGQGEDLTVIGGIGPKIQSVLNELGIWTYRQIAAWTPENVVWLDQHLNFGGRIQREKWVAQARSLTIDT